MNFEFNESTAMIIVFGLVVNALALWLVLSKKSSGTNIDHVKHTT